MDPNVLVSAWIPPHGFPRRILDAADEERFETVVSEKLLGELSDVLMRRYGPPDPAEVTSGARAGWASASRWRTTPSASCPTTPRTTTWWRCRASGADYLVSGDLHLVGTSLGEGAVPVLTPRQFSELLESGSR